LRYVSTILFFIVLIFSFSFIGKSGGADGILAAITGKHSQDSDILHDVYILSENIPAGTVISVPERFCGEWSLFAYLVRIGYPSIDCYTSHEYYLTDKTTGYDDRLSNDYKEIPLNLNKYKLFKRVR